jgi:hypothetical protein
MSAQHDESSNIVMMDPDSQTNMDTASHNNDEMKAELIGITFEKLRFDVITNDGDVEERRTILHDLTGAIEPGTMTAVVCAHVCE